MDDANKELDLIKASPGYYKHGTPPKRVFYRDALGRVTLSGLWLEFGTGRATSTSILAPYAKKADAVLYTFDWLKGLPEEWVVSDSERYAVGTFKTEKEHVLEHVGRKEHIRFVEGLFRDSLPPFLAEHSGPVAFMHVDCDIYSSTSFVLTSLRDRITAGTIIIFDEYWNYLYYRNHEYRAWQETGFDYEYIGYVADARQVALVVK